MYLSRLTLNPRSRQVRSDIADCHKMHTRVLSAFPRVSKGCSARENFGVLHRVEVSSSTNRVFLYVQSSIEPDWSVLADTEYVLGGASGIACKSVSEHYDRIHTGMLLRFRLKANPTKKMDTMTKEERLAGKPKRNGRRVPLSDEESQLEWLTRRGEHGGFELVDVTTNRGVPDVSTVHTGLETGRRMSINELGGSTKSDTLTFKGVVFDGYLRVTDKDAFSKTLRTGVGSGKAYGFGLLTVAKSV